MALFERAKPGNVGRHCSIARYDAEQASSYGYYLLEHGRPVAKPIGSVAKDRNQTLNPELENDSQTSFDPGTLAFGLYLRIGKRTFFSVDDLNGRLRSHVARASPCAAVVGPRFRMPTWWRSTTMATGIFRITFSCFGTPSSPGRARQEWRRGPSQLLARCASPVVTIFVWAGAQVSQNKLSCLPPRRSLAQLFASARGRGR